jgi:hypothetical protein
MTLLHSQGGGSATGVLITDKSQTQSGDVDNLACPASDILVNIDHPSNRQQANQDTAGFNLGHNHRITRA